MKHTPLSALSAAALSGALLLSACLSPSPGAAAADEDTRAADPADPADPAAPIPPQPYGPSNVPIEVCVPAGGACNTSAACCGDDRFCTGDGAYFVGTCEARLADGQPCHADAWCASEICWFGTCGEPSCAATGSSCQDASECCDGVCLRSVPSPYVPGECGPPRPNGAACEAASWCRSGVCTDGACAEPTCADVGARCWWGGECCGGLCLHDPSSPYVPGTCGAPLADGSACVDSTWCASGACHDGVCSGLPCTDIGASCFIGSDCCTTVCSTESVGHYGEGSCQDRLSSGAYCWYDSWCKSGDCDDFTCAP